jgi:hypothetical protein
MPFPKKFKKLIETTTDDIEIPDFVWLAYSVCACTSEACAWSGWIVEGALKKIKQKNSTSSGDKSLPIADESQICPNCGHELFRTSVSIKYVKAKDQKHPFKDVKTLPIKYV